MISNRGLSWQDLESVIGNHREVEEVLNRQQPLTLEMIRRLHSSLRIPAKVLIQPYSLTKNSA